MNLISTMEGSLIEQFLPKGWDLERIDACCEHHPEEIFTRQSHWHEEFQPVMCDHIYDFNTYVGHEIAWQIKWAREHGER